MKRGFIALTSIAALTTVLFYTPQALAQSSPLRELRVTITGYSTETITPGSTFQVTFTAHKPAGIKITDSYFSAYAVYYTDNLGTHVSTPIFGSSKIFYSLSLDEQDVSQELTVKISENASIGQTVYIEVGWYIGGINVSIDENENQVTVISGNNTFTEPIVYTSTSDNVTRYYLVMGLTNYVWVQSDRSDLLIVVGRGVGSPVVPRALDVYAIVAIVGMIIVCMAIGIVIGFRKKGR